MNVCKNCGDNIPYRIIIENKEINCQGRLYCVKCNPIGSRNFWRGKAILPRKDGKRFLLTKKFVCIVCGRKISHKTRNKECSTCRSKRFRNLHKQQAIDYLGSKCSKCGYNKCQQVLSFHHKNMNEKNFTLSCHWDRNMERLKPELDKCILLCANCHMEFHMKIETEINKNVDKH